MAINKKKLISMAKEIIGRVEHAENMWRNTSNWYDEEILDGVTYWQ